MTPEDQIEEDAEAAAVQYIKSKYRRGEKVNEAATRRRALKQRWKPNKEGDDEVK